MPNAKIPSGRNAAKTGGTKPNPLDALYKETLCKDDETVSEMVKEIDAEAKRERQERVRKTTSRSKSRARHRKYTAAQGLL